MENKIYDSWLQCKIHCSEAIIYAIPSRLDSNGSLMLSLYDAFFSLNNSSANTFSDKISLRLGLIAKIYFRASHGLCIVRRSFDA